MASFGLLKNVVVAVIGIVSLQKGYSILYFFLYKIQLLQIAKFEVIFIFQNIFRSIGYDVGSVLQTGQVPLNFVVIHSTQARWAKPKDFLTISNVWGHLSNWIRIINHQINAPFVKRSNNVVSITFLRLFWSDVREFCKKWLLQLLLLFSISTENDVKIILRSCYWEDINASKAGCMKDEFPSHRKIEFCEICDTDGWWRLTIWSCCIVGHYWSSYCQVFTIVKLTYGVLFQSKPMNL